VLIELSALTSLPTLTTDRLTLRSLADDDVEDLFASFSDPEAMR
jgi:RimJ/RimL family protein N-acetyltransferase